MTQNSTTQIKLTLTKFPAREAGFPGCLENLDLVTNLESSSTLFSDKLGNYY
jgi:hypothetical protein